MAAGIIDAWWMAAAAVVLGMASLLVLTRGSRRKAKSRWRSSRGRRERRRPEDRRRSDFSRLGDTRAQMEFISRVDFEPQRLLNRSEYQILRLLEKVVHEIGGGHRVMAQTVLGEVIAPKSPSASNDDRELARRSINSKRLDFLVINRSGWPHLAVEYQGHGHYQDRAFMRDAVKREALRKAGVEFLEIPADYDAEELERRIRSLSQQGRARERSP